MDSVNFNSFCENYFCSWDKPESCSDVVLLALKALSFITLICPLGLGLAYGISKLSCSSSSTIEKADEKAKDILVGEIKKPIPDFLKKEQLPDWLSEQLIDVDHVVVETIKLFNPEAAFLELKPHLKSPITWVSQAKSQGCLCLNLEAVFHPANGNFPFGGSFYVMIFKVGNNWGLYSEKDTIHLFHPYAQENQDTTRILSPYLEFDGRKDLTQEQAEILNKTKDPQPPKQFAPFDQDKDLREYLVRWLSQMEVEVKDYGDTIFKSDPSPIIGTWKIKLA